MITSIYKEMMNLSSRKTRVGLEIFNSLVESGLVRFLSAKEEKKIVTVNVAELAKARSEAEKALATARSVKSYRATSTAKKAVKASRRIFAGLSRKVKSLGVVTLDSLQRAEGKAQQAYTALRMARAELQVSINNLAEAKEGNRPADPFLWDDEYDDYDDL